MLAAIGNGRHYQGPKRTENKRADKDTRQRFNFAQHTFFVFYATAQVAHLVLPDTQRPTASQNQTSHFFPTL
jgi:hypothetical protein